MRFDLAETGILVTRVAEAADEEPFQRVTLQLEPRCDSWFRELLKFFQMCAFGNQAFDHAARNSPSLLANAIAQLWYARSIRAARTIHGLGRNVESCHDAWKLAYKI